MQPYLFPYIGYFQLVCSVDKFVVYDDVTFIKQGWINRNNLLLNGQPFLFTVPLQNASSNTLIRDSLINKKAPWADKLLKTIHQAYRKAPQYAQTIGLLESVLTCDVDTISQLATESITAVSRYLGFETEIKPGSSGYNNRHLTGQDRVIDICKLEHASHYHNPIGGQELYSKADFASAGLELRFIKTPFVSYSQFNDPFLPWLSIIDVLMFNEPAEAKKLVQNYELI